MTWFARVLAAAFLAAPLAAGAASIESAKSAAGAFPDQLSSLISKYGLKKKIVKPAKGLLKHPYLVPSGKYFQLFDWDMYFMGVALSYDKVSAPIMSSVKDFLYFVDEFANETGYAPREIAPGAIWALPEMAKPFMAQAALRASLTAHRFKWLLGSEGASIAAKQEALSAPKGASRQSYYQKLKDMLSFWERNRRAPDGLFLWYNGVESGVDNNPAVSDAPSQATEGVDLQCYIYREYLALAYLAKRLGFKDDQAAYLGKARALKALTRKLMWSEADGSYWNIDSRGGAFVKIKTWTNFVPLWAKLASPAQARTMIEKHLLNPEEFWAPWGVRSLSKDEPLYNPGSGYWRGPVWVLSNYFMMHGLLNYGYKPQAGELAGKTSRLLVKDFEKSGGMNENYDPDSGAPAASGHFVSWNLLAEHMQEEAVTGADPAAIPSR